VNIMMQMQRNYDWRENRDGLRWSRRQDGNHGGFTRETEATHMSI
jgi:hypothetical protein